MTTIDAGGLRWEVTAPYRDCLLGPDGLRLPEWLADGRAVVIKQGPHRTVYRVVLGSLTCYVKHYPVADLGAWVRQLVRPSKARSEYRKALQVAARGVPTFVPLAIGERTSGWRPGESYLVTASLEDTEPLCDFVERRLQDLPAGRQARVRMRLFQQLGAFLAHMHQSGIVHHDLHPANLLVRLDPEDQVALFLIDLHAVRLGGPVGRRASEANLILLNRWLSLRVSRVDRRRFLEAYTLERQLAAPRPRGRGVGGEGDLASSPSLPTPLPQGARGLRYTVSDLSRRLEEHTWASNLAFWRDRDERCLVNNRHFRRIRSGSAGGYAVTDLDPATVASLLDDPDEPFRRPGVRLLKDSRSSTVAEFQVALGGVLRPVIYKRFRVTSWQDPWVALVRRSAALRSWIYGHGLRERCLATPRPLLMLHRRRRGLDHEGYLLTLKVEGAQDLHRALHSLQSLPESARLQAVRAGIDEVARLIRELHRREMSHRDLKASNLLMTAGPDGAANGHGPAHAGQPSALAGAYSRGLDNGPGKLWLIDLVGVRLYRRLPWSRRVQNLARLNASFLRQPQLTQTDRLRFLRVYQEWGLNGRCAWKSLWREIAAATATKVARNQRTGRPLA